MRLKNHVLRTWEEADRKPELIEDGALNVVVVGGGPTGVETAGALAELYNGVFKKDYPDVPEGAATITLVEAGPEIFPMFKPDIREYTVKALEKRGVEVKTGDVVESIAPTRVKLKSGTELEAHTLVWGAGLQGNELVQSLGLELGRGNRIGVDEELRIPSHPEVYAVGDVAAITDAKTEQVLPQLGSVALQSGEHAGETICEADRRQGDEAVQVQGQGDDGGDRARLGRRADARRQDDEGQDGAAGLGHGAPRAAADQRGPGEGRRRLGRGRADAPALGPHHRGPGGGAGLGGSAMSEALFEELGRRGHEPLLEKVSGTHPLRDRRRQADRPLARQHPQGRSVRLPEERARRLHAPHGQGRVRPRGQRQDERDGRHAPGRHRPRGRFRAPGAVPAASPRTPSATRTAPRHRCRPTSMSDGLIKILDGNTFVVSDTRGDIEASLTDPTGLFSFDTRFLSKWVLSVNGERLNPLSVDDLQYFETRFFLVPGTGTVYVDSKLSVIRQRAVGNGFHEELTILNHDEKPVGLTVRVDAGCDFADLFEVKDALSKKGKYLNRVEKGQLRLVYERDKYVRSTVISATAPARLDKDGLTFKIKIEPHGTWTTDLDVVTAMLGYGERHELPKFARGRGRQNMQRNLERWLEDAPTLECDWEPLKATYRRSLVDLAALRFTPPVAGGRSLPAAGLPWFMTMFGRDSILTSLQALPFTPELAKTTLLALGGWQGSRVDDFRDEDPGRILHEMRYGELTAFEERPHSPYYGCADATPLYVVLLDEYERWTGDRKLVRSLELEARAALNWIDEYADLQGDGYIWYQRRNEKTGLENQCWKDSWDSISYRDGRLPDFPRATCELQGYAYDAKMRGARLAREVWKDPAFADELEKQAAELKRRFNRDFWVEDDEYFALALDTEGKQVDALASNNGHLLWSGIVDKSKAKAVVRQLMGPRLFCGWGVRTLAEGEARFNPIGYHVGTVWPFDNSFIAWGLRRYGFKDEAAQIAAGILDAAEFFDGRLPEAFGGYERTLTRYPVQYPTACSPQAWSTGAPLLLLRTMLGLEPVGEHLVVDPALPAGIGHLELLDVPGRWHRVDAFGRGRVDVDGKRAPLRPQLGVGGNA